MEIVEIISTYLEPKLKDECHRLGIPTDFIISINARRHKPFECGSRCYPENNESGSIVGVAVSICDDCIRGKPGKALSDFRHELRHAKDYYHGLVSDDADERMLREAKANMYARRRYLESVGEYVLGKLKALF